MSLWQDLRYALRLLRLNPGFALVAILSLALGIGANTAIFQLLDAVRLRTLPVKNPQELAIVRMADMTWSHGNFSSRYSDLTNPLWEQIREHQQAFSAIAAWSPAQMNLATGGEARYAQGLWVSGDFFRVVDVPALLGRVFSTADDRRGCGSPGAVVSYAFWQRELGGDPGAIGRKLTLDSHPYTVIGVTPAAFFGVEMGRYFDVAIPVCAQDKNALDERHHWWLAVLGRLKPGWTLTRASAHLAAITPGILQATIPPVYKPDAVKRYLEYRLGAFSAAGGFSRLKRYYDPLWLLLATAALVLLIACANLANLMLARASAREREIAVRLAMGASRSRLVRQLLSESLLLAFAGAALGALLASAMSRFLVIFLSTRDSPLFLNFQPDWRVLAFTAALAVVTCVLFGLAPAWRATAMAPGAALKSSSRSSTAGGERSALRRALVVAQVALSLVLLVGALLFSGSLRKLLTLDAGFRQDGILLTQLDMRQAAMDADRRPVFDRDLLQRLRAIPGVDNAAFVINYPISGNTWNQTVLDDNSESVKGVTWMNAVSPGYFRTMGAPLLAGRDFDDRDTKTSPKVAIVNEEFARKFLPGGSPVGRRFRLEDAPGHPEPFYEIVGLVKNMKYVDMREDFKPTAFLADAQFPRSAMFAQVALGSRMPLESVVAGVKQTISQVNPAIGIDFHVLRTQVNDSLLRERLMATLSGFFGALAVLLAIIGLYGVISYMVARRRNEIGIRMALGADRGQVIGLVLGEAAWLLALGLLAGIVLALGLTRAAAALLFGVKPYDPATFLTAIFALAIVALAASLLPARRAARLNPMEALRDE